MTDLMSTNSINLQFPPTLSAVSAPLGIMYKGVINVLLQDTAHGIS